MMDDGELEAFEGGVRIILLELGLDWVRQSIDEGIAAGVNKAVTVPRGSKWREDPTWQMEELPFSHELEQPPGKGQLMVGNTRLGGEQRVALIIQALKRLIVEVPEIHQDMAKRLMAVDDSGAQVDSISFLPDQDDSASPPPSLDQILAPAAQEARAAAAAFLNRMSQEVSDGRSR
ncbi:hypothetical protein OG203_13000 [Nocardia sp. NBC_01499]|uniref:hypothetical protein n=1 Tax=Nocardia sp. NBC_01499 TaxID=2903597 RepID=UPI003863681A